MHEQIGTIYVVMMTFQRRHDASIWRANVDYHMIYAVYGVVMSLDQIKPQCVTRRLLDKHNTTFNNTIAYFISGIAVSLNPRASNDK